MNTLAHTDRLLGESRAFLEVLDHVSQIAPLSKPVLIVGERGTGKELIAARLHYLSGRWDQEYLKMNCAAISESLLETELFGHEAGAFTGATKMHRGRFERADKGSLFLDELATTSALVQEKLLRIIEYGEYERVGGSKTLTTDVRLIAATNEDLPALAAEGKFREDLLDRLAFDVITLPPLRARRDDIVLLAEQFAVNMASEMGFEYFPGFSEQALDVLNNYEWPGNVRELKNVVERSVYRTGEEDGAVDIITLDPFESAYRPVTRASTSEASTVTAPAPTFPIDFKQKVQDYEIDLIKAALAQSQFNQKKTADALSVTYHQLRGYMKKYDLFDSE
ncbi:MAG: phage shock protein operon transcriptional activator [Gammaproteobacteria bacterium]|jgi:psp operon transcriptional activator|nr:phage shock protein operon transcriptional activator [Gammaproteobacteria bacterium]